MGVIFIKAPLVHRSKAITLVWYLGHEELRWTFNFCIQITCHINYVNGPGGLKYLSQSLSDEAADLCPHHRTNFRFNDALV